MGFFCTTIILLTICCGLSSCSEYLRPNFTASYLHFVEVNGVFLSSPSGTYKAAIYNPSKQQTNFYLCVIHDESNTIVWSANRDQSLSKYGEIILRSDGIFMYDENGNLKWSTPQLKSSVTSMHLTEMGNLVLLDQNNISLWDSFSNPTDTVVIGQQLPVGTLLTSAVSSSDLSSGNYSLSVTPSDAVLQWHGSMYWKLSMGLNAFTSSNHVVEYLEVNRSGVYLLGNGGSAVVIQVDLPSADFRIAKLDVSGQLIISSFTGSSKLNQEFVGPNDICRIPFICGKVGLCTDSVGASNHFCSCPSNFHAGPNTANACIPNNSSLNLPSACNSTDSGSSSIDSQNPSYIDLETGINYFAVTFFNSMKYGVNLSLCQDFCSADCSCLGIFYKNAAGSCFLVHKQLGSLISTKSDANDILGYIKAVVGDQLTIQGDKDDRRLFRLVAMLIFPLAALFLVSAAGVVWWKRWRSSRVNLDKLGYLNSPSSEENEVFSIPGLPVRYSYEELKAATDNFGVQIGCGAFGSVYKGTLPDKTVVAVKRITNLGAHGKTEFCTEIAIIGNVHHVNLVKLKGFCAQGRERLLVYEYMNRGSLDRSLFGDGPVLEWQERLDIALGTARGLAYLHSGCEHKIIHCDIKPENILLHHHFLPKISDFGLSKLLSPEQSSHFTTMRGTRGYLAPEWLTCSSVSERTDVYSYGMVLLELVSGRKNCSFSAQSRSLHNETSGTMSSSSHGITYFPMHALEMHEQGRHLELADPRLEGRVAAEQVEKLVRIALCCIHEEPLARPNMGTVVGMLEGRVPVGLPRVESLNFLRFYGRRFGEASAMGDRNEPSQVNQQGSLSSTTSLSPASISFISSQEISGPR